MGKAKTLNLFTYMDIKKIKKLDVEADAIIELVEVNGRQLILKTCTQEEVALDKKFIQVLAENNLPHLNIFTVF